MISGEVVDEVGRPIVDAAVMVLSGPGAYPDVALLTDHDGRFTLGLPAVGGYELGVRADGFTPATVTVAVIDGRAAPLVVRLSPAR